LPCPGFPAILRKCSSLPVELWKTFRRVGRPSFGAKKFKNAINEYPSGMCAENYAMNVTEVNDNNADVSGYFGIVRCGRALVFFSVAALRGSSFDSWNNLVNGMEIAIPKVQSLL